ncbi:MAG: transposase [Dehalococcoidia bacterium]
MKIACELPAERDAPLSQWDCTEIARQLQDDGIVKQISRETVRRVLARHSLRPWRVQASSHRKSRATSSTASRWPTSSRSTPGRSPPMNGCCAWMKTSLQPRPRTAPTHPAAPGRPVRMEHEYGRRGALNLFAAFDTRCGQVLARTASRKRASEFVGFLEYLDASLDPSLTIHLVLDNLRVHKGKLATAWFREHPASCRTSRRCIAPG